MTDRAVLDANYNLRAAVPEYLAYFERYEVTSRDFRRRHAGLLDLAYGRGEREAIDLFRPATAAPPLLVFIHGGYWQSRDRRDFTFVAEPLVEAGAAVALLGYDLAPMVDMDRIVAELQRGIAWLHRHASQYGFDPERIFVAGHSAGGHLAAMALATDWAPHGLPSDLIKGVCAISGVFDLEPIRLCYLNDVLGLDAEQAQRNSPLHLPPLTRCPVTVSVGELETQAFHRQSEAYVNMLRAAGLQCELLVETGMHHFEIVAALANPGNRTTAAIARQLGLCSHAAS